MEIEGTFPIRDKRRRERRDVKLSFREELLADRTGARRRLCPCNICCGETRSMRYRSIVRDHVKRYGRHPYYRGPTEGFDMDESDQE
ncbi:hypothetical protein M758_UG081500, partial [Ceratodon purpureus]